MASKRDTAVIEAEGGASSGPPAPEGRADSVTSPLPDARADALNPHDDGEVTHVSRSTLEPLGHAFCEPTHPSDWTSGPRDACADCGFNREDHNAWFAHPNAPEPGDMTVTDYDANGEAIDREVGPKRAAQEGLPGVGQAGIWGDYQGHRLSHVQLAFGGGPDAPRDLAGKLKIGDRIHLLVTGYVANNGYQQDRDLIYFGKVRVKLDAVTVPGKRFVEDAMVVPEPLVTPPPELIRKALVHELVTRAAEWEADETTVETVGGAYPLPLLNRAADLIADLAHLFDPLPFEEDGSDLATSDDVEEAEPAADAEAMAEA